ncbi:hypothetical protein TRIATDRAFT_280911 [Trichoderma atroviride IMI 206040]|uniref:Uncharacterized protein n=1 Tax=Hypocrea atroviridis (strain ATCC 20476 / IMI 206040) TaxID=452589 RepID=G9NJ07_HYPAI|nr:uncharacterized protein TRIATDRAFT_280911 [Trichoderma atroviride IMI 206040]EHK48884.1 hypothetical protein TRIATDRAFT_280911 [Trichoderma atroviride IMI 206040]
MASRTATESTTVQDVTQIFKRYNVYESLHTVLDNEDSFNSICEILRAIFRCASRKQRILEIAVEEGIFPKSLSTSEQSTTSEAFLLLGQASSSTLAHTTTSNTSPSEQNVIRERTETSEHDQTSETSPSDEAQASSSTPEHTTTSNTSPSEQNVTQGYTETPQHDQTSLSPAQSVTQECIQTPQHDQTGQASQTSLSPAQSVTQECIQTPQPDQTCQASQTSLSPAQSVTQECIQTPQPDQTCQASQTSLSPAQSVTQERTETPGSTSISGDALNAKQLSLPVDASTPKSIPNSRLSVDIDLAPDSAIELSDALPPPYSSLAEYSPTSERSDSGIELSDHISDEDLALPNSPRIEISTTTEEHEAIIEDQTTIPEIPFADRASTKEMSSLFRSWIQNPQENFWKIENSLGLKEKGDFSARLKFFVQNAIIKRTAVNIQKLQYRFTSILVYQSYRKIMDAVRITPALTRQFLERIDISLESEKDCTLLLRGGKNRIEFHCEIAPHKDAIDYGPQCIPELNDNLWDYPKDAHSRVRVKVRNAIAKLQSQNITLWSERSRAQLAAKRILCHGQKFLGLIDVQTKDNETKRTLNIIDQTSSSNVYKRIHTDPTTPRTGFQALSPNIHRNAASFQPAIQNSSLSIRSNQTFSSPGFRHGSANVQADTSSFGNCAQRRDSLEQSPYEASNSDATIPTVSSDTNNPSNTGIAPYQGYTPRNDTCDASIRAHDIEDCTQTGDDAAKITNGYNDAERLANLELVSAVDTLPSETAYDSTWYNGYDTHLFDFDWYSKSLDLGSPDSSFNTQGLFSTMR